MGQDRNPREQASRAYYAPGAYERAALDTAADEPRSARTYDHRRGPPMGIGQALQEHCNLPGKFYFVVVIGNDGKPTLFTAPNYPTVDAKKFINLEALSAEINQAMPMQNPLGTPYEEPDLFTGGLGRAPGEMSRRWNPGRQFSQSGKPESFEGDDGYKMRKRNRRPDLARDELADSVPGPTSSSASVRKSLRIGDNNALWDFYDQRFKDCQQTACKLIAKAWVKAVEPKKQSTFPYTGSDDKAPGWWPKPWGKTKEEKVRHKEPDHLLKRERVHLLVHILKLVVQPMHSQHEAIASAKLNVDKLESITEEALSAFFNDNELPGNAKKRPFLKELFKVARKEEQFMDGGIDASTTIYVSNNDQVGLDLSDTDEYSPPRDEEETMDSSALSSSAPSQRDMAATQSIIPNHAADAVGHIQHGAYVGEITSRPPFVPQLLPPQAMGPDRAAFDGSSLTSPNTFHSGTMGMADMYASPHDSSRRSSLFPQTPEYASPTTPLYTSWPPGSTAPTSQSLYYTTTQAAGSNAPFASQSAPGVTSGHHYYGHTFDALPRGPEDPNANGVFRPNSVGNVPPPWHSYGLIPGRADPGAV